MLAKDRTLTRILIANMPKMLQEMVASVVSSEPRFTIVGTLSAQADLLSEIRERRPDVVITQKIPNPAAKRHGPKPRNCTVNVLAIGETGHEAALYDLTLKEKQSGGVLSRGLIRAVHRAAKRP